MTRHSVSCFVYPWAVSRVHEQVFGVNRGGVDPFELKPLAAPFLSTEYKSKCLGAIEMMGDLRPQPAAAEHQRS